MYDRNELKKYSIYDLREIGKALGVEKPSMKKKGELIDAIIDVETGVVKPTFTNLGRPRLKALTSISIQEREQPIEPTKEVDPIEEEVDKVLAPLKDLLVQLMKNQRNDK